MEQYLSNLYYNPQSAASYSSLDKFYEAILDDGNPRGLTLTQVEKWLKTQPTYTKYKPLRRNFLRNKVNVLSINQQLDIDLMSMETYSKYNEGYQHILISIDIFSRFLRIRKLKTRKCEEIVTNFQSILNELDPIPSVVRSDKAAEFRCKLFKNLLNSKNIYHILTMNEVKANYAERVIQTLKRKLFRYFSYKQTFKWIDVLDDIVTSYNNTIHSTLKRAPSTINKHNEQNVWGEQYILPALKKASKKTKRLRRRFKFKVGDKVRISHLRVAFERAYLEKFTGEIFIISERFRREGIPVYKLTDWGGDEIVGTFYQAELTKVLVDDKTTFDIDKIIKTRKKRGKKEYLVRWRYYGPKFDSWVSEKEVKAYKKK